MNRILVIGATGHIGRAVVSQLVTAGARARAMVRNPAAAALPPEIEIVPGDLTRPETLDSCLEGMDSVFLVWTAPPDTAAPVIERIANRALRIIYLSAPIKTQHPFFQSSLPNASSVVHERNERLIQNSGLRWTILRPGMFALNSIGFWAPQIRVGDVVRWPYLSAPTAPIDERDIAAVAVRALTEDGHAGVEYVITGPQALTQSEQISIIGRALRRSLRIEEISPEDARREVFAGFPPSVVDLLLKAWSAAIGHPAFMTSTVEHVTRIPARTFSQWATDHAAAFQ